MCAVRCQSEIKFGLAFLLLVVAVKVSGANPTPATSPKTSLEGVPAEWVGKDKHPFLKVTKPPFPVLLRNEVAATQGMKYNAIVKLSIDHGKIVATPIGGNSALVNYLARVVQSQWVADPRLTGTFTFPTKFRLLK
jgi:hypothetical protein